jgi:hypothetical protein
MMCFSSFGFVVKLQKDVTVIPRTYQNTTGKNCRIFNRLMSQQLLIWQLIGSLLRNIFAPCVLFNLQMFTSQMQSIVNAFAVGNQMIGVATTTPFFVVM